jgi:hypothetical protein
VTRPIGDGEPEPRPTDPGFDFSSPRWREPEAGDEADVAPARQRRFRNDPPPPQRGSIDAQGSLQGERGDGAVGTPASPDGPPANPDGAPSSPHGAL